MHIKIRSAMRAAGISAMPKNYPENPRERSCGHWAAFIGSVSSSLSDADDARLKDQQTISKQAGRIAELEKENAEMRQAGMEKGIKLLGHEQNWDDSETARVTQAVLN